MPARLTDRFGGGPLALFGVVLTTVATIPFALIGPHTPIVVLCIAMVFRGIGIGFAFMPAMSAAFASLRRSELSDATPQLNVLQRVGGSIGIAVLAVVLQRGLTGAHTLSAAASAYGTAFLWAAGLTALAIVPCVVLIRAERAAKRAQADSGRDARRGAGGGGGRMSPSAAKTAPDTTMREAGQEFGRAFKGCVGALRRLRGRENRAHGELSDAQYGLLFSLVDHEALPTSELALLADLSPATATGMLDGLVAAGLVSRVRSERDRRVVLTSLTERGRALVEARHARFAPAVADRVVPVLRRRPAHRGGGARRTAQDVRRGQAWRRERGARSVAGLTTPSRCDGAAVGVAHAERDRSRR